MSKSNNSHPLLGTLSIRRKNVADYLMQKAIGFSAENNRRIEIEREEIAKIKQQLKSLGLKVEDDPIDEDEDEDDQSSSKKTGKVIRSSNKIPKPHEGKDTPVVGLHPGWIILIIILSTSAPLVLSFLISNIYALIASFVFVLLLLGIILPYLALQNRTLSQAKWVKSYIATLEQIPLLGNIIKLFGNK